MTTYIKTGYRILSDEDGTITAKQDSQLRFVTEDALDTLRYQLDGDPQDTLDVVFEDTGTIWNIFLDAENFADDGFFSLASLFQITGPSTRSVYLTFDNFNTGATYAYLLEGNDILAGPVSGLANVSGGGWTAEPVTSGAFMPNTDIAITTVPWTSISQNDDILGTDGSDSISAGAGDDLLEGGDGQDVLDGGAGNDTLMGSFGYDTLIGGVGDDVAVFDTTLEAVSVFATTGGIELDNGSAFDFVANDIETFVFAGTSYTRSQVLNQITTIETVILTEENDVYTGSAANEEIEAGFGNDIITPGMGDDTINGGEGTDAVSFINYGAAVIVNLAEGTANSGTDRNILIEIENITGSVFGDFIQTDDAVNRIRASGGYDWMVGSEGADYYHGGSGRDMISYVYSDTGVTVDLGAARGLAGQAEGDRYVDIERVTGSVHADLFYGSEGQDDFRGLGGYDWFVGSAGGRERYDGGTGRDTVAYSASSEGVTASLALGYGSGGDALRDLYTSIENLTGSSHDDTLTGDNGRNILRGLFGEDRLIGNGGVDRLMGGGSDDYIDGGAGWDVAMFDGDRDEYTVTIGTAGVIVDHSGRDGTDTIFNVEALQFADDMVFL